MSRTQKPVKHCKIMERESSLPLFFFLTAAAVASGAAGEAQEEGGNCEHPQAGAPEAPAQAQNLAPEVPAPAPTPPELRLCEVTLKCKEETAGKLMHKMFLPGTGTDTIPPPYPGPS